MTAATLQVVSVFLENVSEDGAVVYSYSTAGHTMQQGLGRICVSDCVVTVRVGRNRSTRLAMRLLRTRPSPSPSPSPARPRLGPASAPAASSSSASSASSSDKSVTLLDYGGYCSTRMRCPLSAVRSHALALTLTLPLHVTTTTTTTTTTRRWQHPFYQERHPLAGLFDHPGHLDCGH